VEAKSETGVTDLLDEKLVVWVVAEDQTPRFGIFRILSIAE
jgi:hypothetical protein